MVYINPHFRMAQAMKGMRQSTLVSRPPLPSNQKPIAHPRPIRESNGEIRLLKRWALWPHALHTPDGPVGRVSQIFWLTADHSRSMNLRRLDEQALRVR